MFKRLKMGQKLSLSFAVLLALISLSLAINVMRMNTVSKNVKTMAAVNARQLFLAQDLKLLNYWDLALYYEMTLAQDDMERRTSISNEVTENMKKAAADLEELQGLPFALDGKELLGHIAEAAKPWSGSGFPGT